jgi:hypothetical protein
MLACWERPYKLVLKNVRSFRTDNFAKKEQKQHENQFDNNHDWQNGFSNYKKPYPPPPRYFIN